MLDSASEGIGKADNICKYERLQRRVSYLVWRQGKVTDQKPGEGCWEEWLYLQQETAN